MGGLWATLPGPAGPEQGHEMDLDHQKHEKKHDLCAKRKESCFFMFLRVQVHFVTLPRASGARQSCPKPSQDPKTSPKPLKTPNPEKPSEGGLSLGGEGAIVDRPILGGGSGLLIPVWSSLFVILCGGLSQPPCGIRGCDGA